MGQLVVTEFITLDGVVEDPGGAEKSPRGGWAFRFDRGVDGDAFKGDELRDADAQLLGRVTYEGFARAWPNMTSDWFGQKMNAMPKHVVASRPLDPEWCNATRLEGDLADGVAELKARYSGNILVAGSITLARALMALGLVDELRLMLFPAALGGGRRLFDEGSAELRFALREVKPAGECATLVYGRRDA